MRCNDSWQNLRIPRREWACPCRLPVTAGSSVKHGTGRACSLRIWVFVSALFVSARWKNKRPNLPLEGKGDREAVDEVYDRQFPLCSVLLRSSGSRMFFFRKNGQAGSRPPVRSLHLIRHLPCGKCQLPLEGKLRLRVFLFPRCSLRRASHARHVTVLSGPAGH